MVPLHRMATTSDATDWTFETHRFERMLRSLHQYSCQWQETVTTHRFSLALRALNNFYGVSFRPENSCPVGL